MADKSLEEAKRARRKLLAAQKRKAESIVRAREDIAIINGQILVLEREITSMEAHLKKTNPPAPKPAKTKKKAAK